MNNTPRDSRCKGRTRYGRRCRAAPTAGGLCFFHANPNKAAELGRIGGGRKRRVVTETDDPLPTLDKATAVRDTVDRLIAEVYSGKLSPRIATGLAPLLHLQLRAIDAISTTDRDLRLDQVEKAITELEEKAELKEKKRIQE